VVRILPVVGMLLGMLLGTAIWHCTPPMQYVGQLPFASVFPSTAIDTVDLLLEPAQLGQVVALNVVPLSIENSMEPFQALLVGFLTVTFVILE
jgi:hypothetical protein